MCLYSNYKSGGVGLGYQFFWGDTFSILPFLRSCDEDDKVNLLICNLSVNCDSKLSISNESVKSIN